MEVRDYVADDSDAPEEEEEIESDGSIYETPRDHLFWTGSKKNKKPMIYFTIEALADSKTHPVKQNGVKYGMSFKITNECRIVRNILQGHGFSEQNQYSSEFNLMWTGRHLKPETVKVFQEHQRINHFPRAYEITRKDRLYKNVEKMQQLKGYKNFDFVPVSFIMPAEYQDFCNHFIREKGIWICKPCALSRGRGIYLVTHPDQIVLDENSIVCKYISNPLLVDGYKFDLRLYIVVTSFDPLMIWMYEEGLVRFATVKFDKSRRNVANACMHLTNYSVNKRSAGFRANMDANVENQGSKWALGALLRHLKNEGCDTTALMMRIEDVVIKTILAAEPPIATATRMFVPYPDNCFELYGFDVLIDSALKPWIVEVNLSPSLACESPLDHKIKSAMLVDMFNLVGFPCHKYNRGGDPAIPPGLNVKLGPVKTTKKRPSSGSSNKNNSKPATGVGFSPFEEARALRKIREADRRCGGFIRIFPSADSWDLYGGYFDPKSHSGVTNRQVHEKLYPERSTHGRTLSYASIVLKQSHRLKRRPVGTDPEPSSTPQTTNMTPSAVGPPSLSEFVASQKERLVQKQQFLMSTADTPSSQTSLIETKLSHLQLSVKFLDEIQEKMSTGVTYV